MAEHGGYRAPAKPASVSGPGKYSKRTDGGPAQVLSAAPDQDYGQQKTQLDAQRLAPMGAAAPMPPSASPASPDAGQQMPAYQGGAFNAPSSRPGEPITTGVDIGPGAGSNVLNVQPVQPGKGTGAMTALLQKFAATDTTGILGQLLSAAQQRGA